jgi:hypothetical protein
MAYGNYTTSPVPNTTLQELFLNGVLKGYEIKAANGYLLHDKDLDMPELDENFNETGNIIPWFTGHGTSVRLDYDYTVTTQGEYKYTDENGMEITVPVTMIGAREFYTVPENIVPEDQKLGGGSINPPVTE